MNDSNEVVAADGSVYVGIDLSAEYLDLSLRTRLREPALDFGSSGGES